MAQPIYICSMQCGTPNGSFLRVDWPGLRLDFLRLPMVQDNVRVSLAPKGDALFTRDSKIIKTKYINATCLILLLLLKYVNITAPHISFRRRRLGSPYWRSRIRQEPGTLKMGCTRWRRSRRGGCPLRRTFLLGHEVGTYTWRLSRRSGQFSGRRCSRGRGRCSHRSSLTRIRYGISRSRSRGWRWRRCRWCDRGTSLRVL